MPHSPIAKAALTSPRRYAKTIGKKLLFDWSDTAIARAIAGGAL
jgi:hypothetical protein